MDILMQVSGLSVKHERTMANGEILCHTRTPRFGRSLADQGGG
jgi:hypothetical protein